MGHIVGAFAMSHVLGAPDGLEAQAERVFQGMREIGRRLQACKPDLIVVISSDHLNNFSLAHPQPLALGVADSYIPYGDMGIPQEPIKGQAEFAGQWLHYCQQQAVPLEAWSALKPDHGIMIPLSIVDPDRTLPMVPLYINTVFDPAPTPSQCWQLGELLRTFIHSERTDSERVAILACGGLSHWLGVPDEGRVEEGWDREFMAQLLGEQRAQLQRLSNADILHQAGNGGLEVNAWIVLAGAMPASSKGEVIFYEAIPAWASGMAGVEVYV